MENSLLRIQDLTLQFVGEQSAAVKGLNFHIQPSECVSLVGESGSGKSLSALAIMQLLPDAACVSAHSRILFDGQDLLKHSEKQMRRVRGKKIAMIFQDAMAAFNPVLTMGHQLLEAIKLHQSLSRRHANNKALDLLEQVGIAEPNRVMQNYVHQLSGGMRQRAMIAMALAGEPQLLIADEPTTALDVTLQAQVLELLISLQRQKNMALLFISHDLAIVSKLADKIVVLKQGECQEQAITRVFFHSPKTKYSQKLLASIPSISARHSLKQSSELLTIKNLKVYFPIRRGILRRVKGYIKAVDGVNLTIPQGQTLALVGESGSGKSTIGKAILKLLPITQGEIKFSGKDLTELSWYQIKLIRRNLQIVFQDPYSSLNPRMLVFDIIVEGLIAQNKIWTRRQAKKRVDELLMQVDLPSTAKWRYPHEFSGGQRQRIGIARALALEPKLLILDEPTSALDVSIQMQILKLLEDLQERLGLSYLLITHNLAVVAYMAEQLAVMRQGKIVEQGETVKLLNDPQHPYTKKLLHAIPKLMREIDYE